MAEAVGVISVYGTPFPTGTADLDNSYLREAALTVPRFRAVVVALLFKQEIWPRQ